MVGHDPVAVLDDHVVSGSVVWSCQVIKMYPAHVSAIQYCHSIYSLKTINTYMPYTCIGEISGVHFMQI